MTAPPRRVLDLKHPSTIPKRFPNHPARVNLLKQVTQARAVLPPSAALEQNRPPAPMFGKSRVLMKEKYCWWKKSCTSWYIVYPMSYRFFYIPSGAGILPSTIVKPSVFSVQKVFPRFFHARLVLDGRNEIFKLKQVKVTNKNDETTPTHFTLCSAPFYARDSLS